MIMDFAKAFNKVSRKHLFYNLKYNGTNGQIHLDLSIPLI